MAENFVSQYIGRQKYTTEAIKNGEASKYTLADGTIITYRPAGVASNKTSTTTATVEINNSKVRNLNYNLKQDKYMNLKLKFPRKTEVKKMSNFDINKYFQSLIDQLLQCTADDFSLTNFYDYYSNLNIHENKIYLQIFVEFIYRCLKCDLIELNIGYQRTSPDADDGVDSLEDLAKAITKRPLHSNLAKFGRLDSYIWIEEQVYATGLLDQIAQECHLIAYEDDVDFNEPRGQKFKNEIEKVWADNGLPWDLAHPLFPVP